MQFGNIDKIYISRTDTGETIIPAEIVNINSVDITPVDLTSGNIDWGVSFSLKSNISDFNQDFINKITQVDYKTPFDIIGEFTGKQLTPKRYNKRKRILKKWIKKYGYTYKNVKRQVQFKNAVVNFENSTDRIIRIDRKDKT